jgi:hypothetical protein
MNTLPLGLHRLPYLFQNDPVATVVLLLLIAITAVAICVAAYVGACTARDLLKKRREERLRDAVLAQSLNGH